MRYVGTVPAAVRTAAEAAVRRIRAVVTTSVGTQSLTAYDMGFCGAWIPSPLTATVRNHLLFVAVIPIDGPGQALARAGPCLTWRNSLVRVSAAEIDESDVGTSTDRLTDILLHEMMHTLGVGASSAWTDFLTGATSADPQFTGLNAVSAWRTAGGTRWNPTAVPVESGGGDGTAGAHWREEVLDAELMTGYYNAGRANPLSAITVGALRDLGYQVGAGAADAYTVPSTAALRAAPGESRLPFDVVLPHRVTLPDPTAGAATPRRVP